MAKPIKIKWTSLKLHMVVQIFREVVMPAKCSSIEETVYASIFYDLEEKLEKKYINHRKKNKPFAITLKYHETAVLTRYLMNNGHLCPGDKKVILASFIQDLNKTIQY